MGWAHPPSMYLSFAFPLFPPPSPCYGDFRGEEDRDTLL